ncbi:hypothetical protein TREPR_1448 [Treponema primitia ZAS-2]|uniref:Uncharacterized protein n=1 Tax=Treponema primitia (strain ATCC BAA-887 / DSM 12427 / ZAS-2) TaxID=545694 RepID=F5YQ51_TREPZ|nr:hypothetical protein TREPR_1448 [Treponema primitia ZAS-2]
MLTMTTIKIDKTNFLRKINPLVRICLLCIIGLTNYKEKIARPNFYVKRVLGEIWINEEEISPRRNKKEGEYIMDPSFQKVTVTYIRG